MRHEIHQADSGINQISVDVWLRYFARREAEGFGPKGEPLAMKRSDVLGYVRKHCPHAVEIIEGQASFAGFGYDLSLRRAA